MACAICPEGCGTVFKGSLSGDTITWTRLVHVDTWNMTPNRQEATKKRTSDTGGNAVKFCSDIIDWTITVTNTLCTDDWLYADILANQRNPSIGVTAWFFLGWACTFAPTSHPNGSGSSPSITDQTDLTGAPGTYTQSDGGVYVYGTVSPPGFGIDNNGTDPATGEWNIDATLGPYLPADDQPTAGTGAYSVSDGDPTNTEAA